MPDRELEDGESFWAEQIDELKKRRSLVAEMGGPENVARQHKAGRLTVRERIERITDKNSFREVGTLAGTGEYDEEQKLKKLTPATYVAGMARIDGRPVAIGGEDFTVRLHRGPGASLQDAAGESHRWRRRLGHICEAAGLCRFPGR
jgi:acetyl-CoA carboxylase carboxyltransferase component